MPQLFQLGHRVLVGSLDSLDSIRLTRETITDLFAEMCSNPMSTWKTFRLGDCNATALHKAYA